MRKLFLLFWALLATTCLWAHDFVVDGIYYDYLDGNNVAVTYKGSSDDAYNNEYSGEVTIPEAVTYNGTTYSVTSIEDYAFYGCSSLTSITIPNSVTSIGDRAFQYCFSLTSITIPNSVTSIGDWAFDDCSSLTSVTIGNSVTSIGEWAFSHCSSLTSVTIPNSVTSIGEDAFRSCSSLTSITIPNSVTSIGDRAFEDCSSLTSITIPNSVTSIGYSAFSGCTSLTSVTIPNSVTSIGDYAFRSCSSLTSITIPNSVTSIGERAFYYCDALTSIVVEDGNATYDSRDNCNAIIETATNTLIAGCQNTIIPNSVTSIGEDAFYWCSSLTSVTIPNSVTSIGGVAFAGCSSLTSITIPNSVTSIGEWAFASCSSLTSMVVEEGNTTYDSRDNCNAIIETATNTLIVGCQNTIIPNSVTSIGGDAFTGCSSLTSITIPNSVTSIGDFAFAGCSSLTSITIPNSVTSIGERAFYYCDALTSVTIGNSVMSIGNYAFQDCSSLTTVICEAVEIPILEGSVFYNVPLADATLYVPTESLEDYKVAEQWKDFGTILPIEGEEPEEDLELQDTDVSIVFTNSEDNDSEIYRQTLTIKVPAAPEIAGFTFLYWQPVAEPITNVITIQAIYEADVPSSAPEVYINPANPAQKLLRNGQVYILQDGQTYTIQGQKL